MAEKIKEMIEEAESIAVLCHINADGDALGSAYGAQMLAKMKEEIDVDAVAASGSLKPISDWLGERIYQYASMYDPDVIFEKTCGAPFDPTYYTDYLEKKYGDIYKL